MRRKFKVSLIIVLLLLGLLVYFSNLPVVFAQAPWYNGYEEGDFSAWNGTETFGGSLAEVLTEKRRRGTYAAKFSNLIDEGDRATSYRNLSTYYDDLYLRCELLVTTTPNSSFHLVLGPMISASGYDASEDIAAALYNLTTSKWGISGYVGGSYQTYWETGTTTLSLDVWYLVELRAVIDGSTGILQLWVDETLKVDESGLDTDDRGDIQFIEIGCNWTPDDYDASFTLYCDSVRADTSYIGAELNPLFEDGFESGDFGAWNGTYVNNALAEVTSGNPYEGTYSANFSGLDSTGDWATAYRNFTVEYSEVYVQTLISLESIPSGNVRFAWPSTFCANNYTADEEIASALYNVTESKLGFSYYDDGWVRIWETGTTSITTDVWHNIETYIRINATEGILRLWFNRDLKIEATGLDTADRGNVTFVKVGSDYCSDNYSPELIGQIDNVVFDTSYIGYDWTLTYTSTSLYTTTYNSTTTTSTETILSTTTTDTSTITSSTTYTSFCVSTDTLTTTETWSSSTTSVITTVTTGTTVDP